METRESPTTLGPTGLFLCTWPSRKRQLPSEGGLEPVLVQIAVRANQRLRRALPQTPHRPVPTAGRPAHTPGAAEAAPCAPGRRPPAPQARRDLVPRRPLPRPAPGCPWPPRHPERPQTPTRTSTLPNSAPGTTEQKQDGTKRVARTHARTHARRQGSGPQPRTAQTHAAPPPRPRPAPPPRYGADARLSSAPRSLIRRRRTTPGFSFCPAPPGLRRRPPPRPPLPPQPRAARTGAARPLRHVRPNPPWAAAGCGRLFASRLCVWGSSAVGTPSAPGIPWARAWTRSLPRPEWRGPARPRRPPELTRFSPPGGGGGTPSGAWRFAVPRFPGAELYLHASVHSASLGAPARRPFPTPSPQGGLPDLDRLRPSIYLHAMISRVFVSQSSFSRTSHRGALLSTVI